MIDRATPETLTDDQICDARAAALIDRDTYEAARHGCSEAIRIVCSAINSRRQRDWIDDVTP